MRIFISCEIPIVKLWLTADWITMEHCEWRKGANADTRCPTIVFKIIMHGSVYCCMHLWLQHTPVNDWSVISTLRQRQNGRYFRDDTFKGIFPNENVRISIKISLKFVPKGPLNKIPALVQIMAWRLPRDKPLSKPMMVEFLTHICVTRPQWVRRMIQS